MPLGSTFSVSLQPMLSAWMFNYVKHCGVGIVVARYTSTLVIHWHASVLDALYFVATFALCTFKIIDYVINAKHFDASKVAFKLPLFL